MRDKLDDPGTDDGITKICHRQITRHAQNQ
jgi:hypothetical protein